MNARDESRSGPLAGLRAIELAGIGPGPHAAFAGAESGSPRESHPRAPTDPRMT